MFSTGDAFRVVQKWHSPFSGHFYRRALKFFHEGQFASCADCLEAGFNDTQLIQDSAVLTRGNDALVLLCRCFLLMDRHEMATELFARLKEHVEPCIEMTILECWIEFFEGNYNGVVLLTEEYLSERRKAVDIRYADVSFVRAYADMCRGDYAQALTHADTCVSLYRVFHAPVSTARTANLKGLLYKNLGRFAQAVHWFKQAATVNDALGFERSSCDNQLNIGVVEYKVGHLAESAAVLTIVLETYVRHGSDANTCRTHIALGNVYRLLGAIDNSRRHLTKSYTMAVELRLPREECLALEFLGDVFRDEGKPDEARRYYARGLAIALEIAPEGDLVMELKRREGECLVLEGQVASALPILAEARRHAGVLGDRFEEGVTVRCLAEAMLAIKDHVGAQRYAEEACEILGAVEARLEHLVARVVAVNALLGRAENVADVMSPRDLLDLAWDHALIAQSLAREIEVEAWVDTVKRLQSRVAKRRVEEARYAAPAVRQVGDSYGGKGVIIAESRAMKEVLQAIEAFAPYDEALLITGETGTGKEVVARRVHEMSTRREGNFVAVNVTAVPTSMFEREFFGHRRGAFSGAENDCDGYATEADGGTLFLDEIGDMAKETQAKLLRLLQDGSYTVLGNPDERHTNLRVVAATNKDLEQAVIDGKFREDLFYRLRMLEINIPPLRKHVEDVVPLLEHFLSQSAERRVSATDYFNRTSLNLMQHYPWPGNAREVSMVARRAHISLKIDGRVLVEIGSGRDALVLSGPGKEAAAAAAAGSTENPQDLSRARLVLALDEAGGNRTEAARRLGISRGALYRRLERFELE